MQVLKEFVRQNTTTKKKSSPSTKKPTKKQTCEPIYLRRKWEKDWGKQAGKWRQWNVLSTGQRLGNGRIANKESFDGESGLSPRQLLWKKSPSWVRQGGRPGWSTISLLEETFFGFFFSRNAWHLYPNLCPNLMATFPPASCNFCNVPTPPSLPLPKTTHRPHPLDDKKLGFARSFRKSENKPIFSHSAKAVVRLQAIYVSSVLP